MNLDNITNSHNEKKEEKEWSFCKYWGKQRIVIFTGESADCIIQYQFEECLRRLDLREKNDDAPIHVEFLSECVPQKKKRDESYFEPCSNMLRNTEMKYERKKESGIFEKIIMNNMEAKHFSVIQIHLLKILYHPYSAVVNFNIQYHPMLSHTNKNNEDVFFKYLADALAFQPELISLTLDIGNTISVADPVYLFESIVCRYIKGEKCPRISIFKICSDHEWKMPIRLMSVFLEIYRLRMVFITIKGAVFVEDDRRIYPPAGDHVSSSHGSRLAAAEARNVTELHNDKNYSRKRLFGSIVELENCRFQLEEAKGEEHIASYGDAFTRFMFMLARFNTQLQFKKCIIDTILQRQLFYMFHHDFIRAESLEFIKTPLDPSMESVIANIFCHCLHFRVLLYKENEYEPNNNHPLYLFKPPFEIKPMHDADQSDESIIDEMWTRLNRVARQQEYLQTPTRAAVIFILCKYKTAKRKINTRIGKDILSVRYFNTWERSRAYRSRHPQYHGEQLRFKNTRFLYGPSDYILGY